MLFPALLLFVVFVIYPFVHSFYYSLTRWDGLSAPEFIGLANFRNLMSDSAFIQAIRNTATVAVVSLIVGNSLSMLLAVLLNRNTRATGLLRTMYYLPAVLSLIVISVLWSIILNYDGVLNLVLQNLGLGAYILDWIGDYETALGSVILIMIWQGLGGGAIFYLAGLQSIPKEVYESAQIDGVKAWSNFRFITLPLIMPSVTIVTFLNITGSLKLFDLPYILNNGGGGSTTTIAMHVYKNAFGNAAEGYAIAGGIVLFVFVAVVSFLQVTITKRREVEF